MGRLKTYDLLNTAGYKFAIGNTGSPLPITQECILGDAAESRLMLWELSSLGLYMIQVCRQTQQEPTNLMGNHSAIVLAANIM